MTEALAEASLRAKPAVAGAPILAVENIEVLYAEVILALKGVNLQVAPGQCTVLLGPNGAGKSTTLKAISGILPVEDGAISAGAVRLDGATVTGSNAQKMVARGVIHVVEGRKVLRHLTVEQNLLADLRQRTAGYLSGGEQQQLLIGRALMSEPRLMLIDEPSLGLAPLMIEEIFRLLGKLKSQGMSLLIVEQNAQAALALADHGYVMEGGRVVLEAPAEQLRGNEDIQEFYLGMGQAGERKSYRNVKHYRRRKRWLG